MHVVIKKTIYKEEEIPEYLKECLKKIELDAIGKDIVSTFDSTFTLEDRFERVFFTVRKHHIECINLKLWTMMRLFYGFEIEYDFREKIFKIGGYETEQLTSKTITGLIKKIEREFGNGKQP